MHVYLWLDKAARHHFNGERPDTKFVQRVPGYRTLDARQQRQFMFLLGILHDMHSAERAIIWEQTNLHERLRDLLANGNARNPDVLGRIGPKRPLPPHPRSRSGAA